MRLRAGKDLWLEVLIEPGTAGDPPQWVWMLRDGTDIRLVSTSGTPVGRVSDRHRAIAGDLLDSALATVSGEHRRLRHRTPICLVELSVQGSGSERRASVGLMVPVVVDNPPPQLVSET